VWPSMADAHPTQPQLLFVDGSLPELTEELGDYLQIGDEVRAHLKDNQAEEALQAIVKESPSLNSVPEAEFTPAYSLLIHLVINSKDPKRYLPAICQNLQKPITTSPQHGTSLALFAFQSIFNFLNYDNPLRYNVWMQILKFVKQTSSWELLKWSSSLDKMQTWFKDWDTDEEGQRRMLVETAEVADDAGDEE
jgi:translation initiation factor 3 subunit M